jgi:Ni/Co efflux regulator RcnB
MKIRTKNIFAICLALLVATYSGIAIAEKGGKHHDKHGYDDDDHGGKKHKKNKHHRSDDDDDHGHSSRIYFGDSNRVVIREYLAHEYAPNCPPGLAKKHNGCLPPGIAKKRYVIGQPLRGEWRPVPHELVMLLEPAPIGYRYVEVDKDVLLISEASKKVIDAVTLLSAVGK